MDRALSEDCLRKVLTFVSVKDCARGAGAASKHLRDLATSTTLTRARGADSYAILRTPGSRGVVHALATAFGTRRWLTRYVRLNNDQHGADGLVAGAAVPPVRLGINIHRVHSDSFWAFS